MGAKCGTLREACLSVTDARYDPNADFGAVAQNDLWERTAGHYKLVGMSYTGDGNVIKESTTTFNGVDITISLENITEFTNLTTIGTRILADVNTFTAPTSTFPFGMAYRNEAYSTTTFELDGSFLTMPPQAVTNLTGTWQEGPSSLSRVVDANTFFATTVNGDSKFALARTCIDFTCKKITEVQQIFQDGILVSFSVSQGEKITADEYTTGIADIIVDYNTYPALLDPLYKEFGQNYPTEEQWCESDPVCSESPYQEPIPALRTGPLVGFVFLGLAVLSASFVALALTMMKRKEKRIRESFGKRMAQSVNLESFSANDPAQLNEMFKKIDDDGNGYIERGELRKYMDEKEPIMPASDFDALWKSIDGDKSGTIDYIEFCVFMAKSLENNE